MKPLQRARRRQRAAWRARRIWWFRRGWAKLGCFNCGHDCYEVQGERCSACGAAIDRDAPWWRHGKHPIWWALTAAAISGPLGFSWLIYDALYPRGATYPIGAPPEHETLRRLTLYVGSGLIFVAIFLAARRGRWKSRQLVIRLVVVTLAWWLSFAGTIAALVWLDTRYS